MSEERCEYVHEFNRRLSETESRSKSNTHRLDELERWQHDQHQLISSVAVMAEKQTRIEEDVGEMKKDVKSILDKPAKRWESVVGKIITAIVGALVAWILMRIGIGV